MHLFPPSAAQREHAVVTPDTFDALYQRSITDPDGFWGEMGQRISWIKPYSKVRGGTGFDGDVDIRWYEDGTLNACYNCVDRHLKDKADKVALIFEADEPGHAKHITFRELHKNVCQLANALNALGIGKGDPVTIYMPMIPEAVYAMLACARVGAIHSVVFAGFSPESLANRIADCKSKLVITANEAVRGGRATALKANTDSALAVSGSVENVLVFKRTGNAVPMTEGRDIWWHDLVPQQPFDAPIAEMNAEDPLFILYTSGSTGKPKGVLHTTGGYMVFASLTHEYSFDAHENDIYWCTADIGWVTGHSYIVYGPLANGITSLVFESTPNHPDFGRFWQVVQDHKVSIFYTAPTAIRALLREGDDWVKKYDRSSLRILGSVGEPINSEAWLWYHEVVGDNKARVIDTYWQTETGGHIITPLPGVHNLKPGSAMRPFFGIDAALLDKDGFVLEGESEGNLVINAPWPGMMRTLYGDHERFVKTYFSTYKGKYFTGDGAKRDADGDYWITGRVDDVLNVSGHRLGTAELESAINQNHSVAESAVVGMPHPIKGQGIYAFVIPKEGVKVNDALTQAIVREVRTHIGPIAKIDCLQWVNGLPKTRSGKIMRRILRKVAAGEIDQLGDVSTLADPSVVDQLVAGRVHLEE